MRSVLVHLEESEYQTAMKQKGELTWKEWIMRKEL